MKDDNIILTANFDTTFRIFDQRTNRDECIWSDPYDASVYCLEYDGLFGVVCGMKYHNRVNLYDIRVPNNSHKFISRLLRNLMVHRFIVSPVITSICLYQQIMICEYYILFMIGHQRKIIVIFFLIWYHIDK